MRHRSPRGAITYQLRRLHLHGLIERVPKSFRYKVTDFGLRVALFFTRTYNRLLRPGLAAALPALRAVTTPLQRAFNTLSVQIDATIKQAQLAAQNLTHPRQAGSLSTARAVPGHVAAYPEWAKKLT